MITQEYLKCSLSYNKRTGIFKWKIARSNAIKIGQKAGCIGTNGYIVIRLLKKTIYAHRLAWLYVNGAWPIEFIDHINGIRNDNRWCNLREATRQQNYQNVPARNELKIKGVYKARKKFIATITVNRLSIPLGKFKTLKLAKLAYKKAAIKYHGEFLHSSLKD